MNRHSYYRFWAKTAPAGKSHAPFHLLPYHNLDVAAVAQLMLCQDRLLAKRLGRLLEMNVDQMIPLVRALVALHDVGKFSERFQALSPGVAQELGGPTTDREYVVRHDTLGFGAWRDILFSVLWDENVLGLRDHRGDRWDWREYFDVLMRPIMGHHGSPPVPSRWQKSRDQFSEESRTAMIAYFRDVIDVLFPDSPFTDWTYSHVEKARSASWLLAGVTVVADWVGSDAERFRYKTEAMPIEEYWNACAIPQAEAAVEQTGFLPPAVSSPTGLATLFPEYVPTPMQKYASEVPLGAGPELFILEDATGSGKTEAALVLAHRLMHAKKAEGLYVGLPTMATANAMYERLGTAYHRLFTDARAASLVLAHGARDLSASFQESIGFEPHGDGDAETYSEEMEDVSGQAQCAAWLADQRKKALLAHVGVGTIDQALLGVLPSNHQSLRLLGLGRSVLIVDEVHAYDVYMQRLLKELLRFQAAHGGSAILLSATLPTSMREALVDAFQAGAGRDGTSLRGDGFPLATHVAGDADSEIETPVNEDPRYVEGAEIRTGYHREIDVDFFHKERNVVDRLVEAAQEGRCACWIRNTVDDARDGWQALRQRFAEADMDGECVGLFHARLALVDRQAIEERVIARYGKDSGPQDRAGRILVATQVVEQSLDLDFDYMVSDLAPIDLLIQRAGRMQRHLRDADGRRIEEGPDGRDGPVFGVFTPPPIETPGEGWFAKLFPRAAYVYPHLGHLWRTARVLWEERTIRIPEGARALVERVYGDDAAPIPEALKKRTREVTEERRKERSIATGNVLSLEQGYGGLENVGRWTAEERAATRLGDPTTTIRLGRLEDGEVVPWANEGDHPWRRSELRIRASKVAEEPHRTGDDRRAVARTKKHMPDEGRWSTLVVLVRAGDSWVGRARNGDGDAVEVRYTAETGLDVHNPTE